MTSPGRGTAHLIVAQGVVMISGFAISVILARGLGPVGYGVYGVVMSVLSWFERTLNGGIPGATSALLARDQGSKGGVEKAARMLVVLWSLPLFTVLWLTAPWMSSYFGIASGTTVFRLAACNIPLMAWFIAYEGILSGRRRFGAVSGITCLLWVAKLLGVIALVLIGLSVSGAFIANAIATLLPVLVAVMIFPLRGAPASKSMLADMVRIALPLSFYAVTLIVLMNLSLWQLQATIGDSSVATGGFVASLNLTKMLMVVPATTSGVLFVSLSWALANARPDLVEKYINEASRFALLTLVPACALLWIDAEPIMVLLYGADYAGSGRVLGLLCIAFGAIALLDICSRALMARGMTVLAAVALAALLPVLIIVNRLWIPTAGAVGAAAASAVTLASGAVLAAFLTYRHYGHLLHWRAVARIATASAIVAALSLLVRASGPLLIIKLGVMLIVYVGLLFVLRELRWHDVKLFAIWKSNGTADK